MAIGMSLSAIAAARDSLPHTADLRRIAQADWVTRWGKARFDASWDPDRGLVGFLAELDLPPQLQRYFDAVPTTDGELHFWWKGQQMPALKKGYTFTVNPTAELNLTTDWDD